MSNWTIRTRILASFGVLLALIGIMGGNAVLQARQQMDRISRMRLEVTALEASNVMKNDWARAFLTAQQFASVESSEALARLGQELTDQHGELRSADGI